MTQKVLLIEDSVVSMKVLRFLTEKAGFEPESAENLAQARHLFGQSQPEDYLCAVVDYNLPDAPDGEAIDYALEAFIPTVVITGKQEESIRNKVLAKDVVDYIPKENAQVYDYLSRLLSRLQKNRHIGVLVVDDSRLSRTMAVSLLRRHNFITYEASDGEQGLERLAQHQEIRLVLTDENMPNMSGIRMVAAIRKKHSKEELAIIGLSGKGSSALSARFIKSGANDYLNKPYCHEEFFCRIVQNIEYIENIEAIHKAANTDYLTGLPNLRRFFEMAESQLEEVKQDVSLAILDIDYFKKINDSVGHDAGDEVLCSVSALLMKNFASNIYARFGGEEFCILFVGEAGSSVLARLENFRKQISELEILFEQHSINLTLSVGVTSYYTGEISASLRQADENLYRAKEAGRNRIVSG